MTPGDAGPAPCLAAVGDGADAGTEALAAPGSRPDGTRQPLCIAVVGAQPDAVRRLVCALERRIDSATGLTVHRGRCADGQDAAAAAPSCAEVVIFESLPAPRAPASPASPAGAALRSPEDPGSLDVWPISCGAGLGAAGPWAPADPSVVDLVLLCRDGGGSAVDTGQSPSLPQEGLRSTAACRSEGLWRERLIGMGVDWCAVGGPGGDAIEQAMDALAPWLRARSRPGSGLFTRLAERNAQQAARLWRCADCDDPDCEHALRSTRPSRHADRPV